MATVLGIVLLVISPNNVYRLQAASVKSPDFVTFLTKSFRFGFDFLHYSLKGKWLPYSVIFFFGFLLNQLVDRQLKHSISALVFCIFTLVSVFYLISVINAMPTVLIRSVYPDDRAWFPTHYLLVFAICTTGFLTSEIVSTFKQLTSRIAWQKMVVVVLVIGLLVYVGRMIPILYSGVSQLQARALAWDQREAWIIEEKSLGVTHITVPSFDTIGRITELQPEENHWVNKCAARYYGVNGITAVENFNGIKPYFE